ncbi:phage major capsid protein [Corynebacterium argentoratense]|uniref:phage major capsid protein n=1 Tax=Corynebacterium argentoratense TaxID=42817 RepID=UPI004040EF42
MKLTIKSALMLTASPAARTISGLALPYGVEGHASPSTVVVNAGAVALPSDLRRVKLLRNHSTTGDWQPVGYCTAASETDAGLVMSFHVAATPEGDRALTEIREGVRDALSVEINDVDIVGGELVAGKLTAVALVPVPAFDDARVTEIGGDSSTVDDEENTSHTSTEIGDSSMSEEIKPAEVDTEATAIAPVDEAPKPAEVVAATAPSGLLVASRGDRDDKITFSRVVDALTAVRSGEPATDRLTAALANITRSANPSISAPEWLGELWAGNGYEREIVPTMTNTPLKSMHATGWRWTTKPTVDDYAGDKAEIPTNTPATEAVNLTVKRLAGGHDIDRAYFDFNDVEFIRAYFQAMSESYAIKTDTIAAKFLATEAKKNKGTKQVDLLRAAAHAKQKIKLDTRTNATSYLVHPDDMFKLLDITTMDNPQYLKLIGVDPELFTSSDQALKGHVIAYNKRAVEFRELSGSPIRVEAEHLAHGGRDAALFGYYATFVANPKGLAAVEFGQTG